VAVDEKWRRQGENPLDGLLNHAALMLPISGELLGERVGRVRTSREMGNDLPCNQPWRKKKKPHHVIYEKCNTPNLKSNPHNRVVVRLAATLIIPSSTLHATKIPNQWMLVLVLS
jgi:hypothetical protein